MIRRVCWLLLLLAMASAGVQAAVPEIPRFRVLGAVDGLPATTIPALARDRDGFLWLATWDGLARYDGVTFRVWRHDPDDAASLPGNIVQALHIDAQDQVWVATENGGLSVLDAQRSGFRHYRKATHPQMHSDDIFTITSHKDVVWFGSFDGGLNRLDAQGRIRHYAASDNDPASLPSNDVMALAFDAQERLWVGTLAGLAVLEGENFRRIEVPVSEGDQPIVYSLTPDAGTMWVGTAEGMFWRLADGEWKIPAWSPMFARPNAVMAMAYSDDGRYWLGGQGGLWRTRGEGAPVPITVDVQGGGTTRVMQSLLREPEGSLWVPIPSRGAGYLQSDWRRIAALTTAEGLGAGIHRGIAHASAGGIWLTSSKGAIERVDTRTGDIHALPWHEEVLKKKRIGSVLEDRRGQLWLGDSRGFLSRIDLSTQAIRHWLDDDAQDPTPGGPIDWLVETAEGDIWLSSVGAGVQRRDGVTGKVLDNITQESGHGLTAADTEALQIGPDGALWLAGAQGMLRWDAAARKFVAVAGIGGGRVFSFTFEDAERLWVHRLGGLELWRKGAQSWSREERLSVAQGVPAVESTGLEIDAARQLWLATRRGLFRVDPYSRQSRHFGVRNGLPSQEFNDGALLLTADGTLVGSMADGAVMLLDTTFPDPPAFTPNLVLDSVQVSRGDAVVMLSNSGDFELQPDDHELQVSARLLAFDDPLANRYRSRLEGLDTDWVDQGASGERVFSSLSPGRYTLRMQAFDSVGNPSQERLLAFRVLPPWWRSAWGIALFTVLGLLLVWLAASSYRRRVRRRSAWQLAVHKRELAEQASLAKTRFLATLGHEVRTPMTGVLGMSELLLGTALNDKQRDYTHAIQNAGTHLLRLVNDALDIARIEAGKLELQQQDFDLRALVDEVVGLMAPMAESRGLSFADDMAADTPGRVKGDAMRVRQILLNLLGNAIKFTDKGGVSLRVSPLLPIGIRLEIRDTGPGISVEQQGRLFQRFEQADGARTAERYGGSGLGLAICQELAMAMGGHIDLESTPGAGTRFIVDLPLWPADTDLPGVVKPIGEVAVDPLRILLVEDDATVAEVITGLLRVRGHQVSHAMHGLAALAEIAGRTFDVALLDLDLPGLDGLALARQLRAQGFTAPLLAVTARSDAQAETQALAAGFDGFLRKPVSGESLAEAIAAAILVRADGP